MIIGTPNFLITEIFVHSYNPTINDTLKVNETILGGTGPNPNLDLYSHCQCLYDVLVLAGGVRGGKIFFGTNILVGLKRMLLSGNQLPWYSKSVKMLVRVVIVIDT